VAGRTVRSQVFVESCQVGGQFPRWRAGKHVESAKLPCSGRMLLSVPGQPIGQAVVSPEAAMIIRELEVSAAPGQAWLTASMRRNVCTGE